MSTDELLRVTILPPEHRFSWEQDGTGPISREVLPDRIIEMGLDGTLIRDLNGNVMARITSKPWVVAFAEAWNEGLIEPGVDDRRPESPGLDQRRASIELTLG